MNCIHCSREIQNKGSLKAHEMCCKENPDKIKHYHSPLSGAKKGSISWSTGLTKEDDTRLARPQFIGRRFASSLTGHTEETKKKLSEIAKKGNYGGYKRGSGRGKKGWYKDIFCDSSWELAYVIWCLDKNISIERCTEKYEYLFQGKLLRYLPDFRVNGQLVEIKGYKSAQWQEKLKQCPVEVTVLYEAEMKPILQYVITTYGKNFIDKYTEHGSSNRLATVPVLKTVER